MVAEVAASAGVPCVVHCAHDLGPKTAAMLHLAASTPNFPLANDCTYYGLVEDVLHPPVRNPRREDVRPGGAGLGIEVDLAKVRKYPDRARASLVPLKSMAGTTPSDHGRTGVPWERVRGRPSAARSVVAGSIPSRW